MFSCHAQNWVPIFLCIHMTFDSIASLPSNVLYGCCQEGTFFSPILCPIWVLWHLASGGCCMWVRCTVEVSGRLELFGTLCNDNCVVDSDEAGLWLLWWPQILTKQWFLSWSYLPTTRFLDQLLCTHALTTPDPHFPHHCYPFASPVLPLPQPLTMNTWTPTQCDASQKYFTIPMHKGNNYVGLPHPQPTVLWGRPSWPILIWGCSSNIQRGCHTIRTFRGVH